MDLIEVFKTGTHTDSQGRTREWTEKDLQEIASQYDPTHHEAPVVIGHPEADSPAYGWVSRLEAIGGRLKAEFKDLAPEFVDWVKRGLYKKISIALYPDMGLRHVGFLGAQPPAIKGLKQAAFAEKPAWTIEIEASSEKLSSEFGDQDKEKNSKISQSKKEGGKSMKEFIEKLKAWIMAVEKDPTLVPDLQVIPSAKFSEADLKAAEDRGKASLFAENERLKKVVADAEAAAAAKIKEAEAKTRNEGIAAFCETLCKEGKLTPALRKIIEPIMIAVSAHSTGSGLDSVEFSEGVKKPALDGLKDFLTEIPKVVTFEEVAGSKKTGPGSVGSAGEKLSVLTNQKMNEKKNLSWNAAFAEVQKENIDLARELLEETRPKA